jgi:micrococcal nuclease
MVAILAVGRELGWWSDASPGPAATGPSASSGVVSPGAASSGFAALTTHVVDGDTIEVRQDGRRQRVRLLGIDTPETSQCGAAEATTALQQLIEDREVRVVLDPAADQRDRYGRTLGYVEVDGRDVGETLVSDGLAAAWFPSSAPTPSRYSAYAAAEQRANQSDTGSWAQCERVGRP